MGLADTTRYYARAGASTTNSTNARAFAVTSSMRHGFRNGGHFAGAGVRNDDSVAEKLDRLPVQPRMIDDHTEAAPAFIVECDHAILRRAIQMAIRSEPQTARTAKRHPVRRREDAHQRPAACVVFSNRCRGCGRIERKLARHQYIAPGRD